MENRIDWRGATLATIALLGLPVILAGFLAGFFFELLRIGFNANNALFETLTDDRDEFAAWVEQVMADHDLDDIPEYMRD